jgi:hypothetical protein
MTDVDVSSCVDLQAATANEPAQNGKAAEDRAFADVIPKRQPPNEIERAQIEKARKRTKARTPRIAMHIEERPTGERALYPHHSDREGHQYRLADAFGTRSLHFVHSMLNSLGRATEDHSQTLGLTPGSPDQDAFNAALAVIDGVRPKDEIEAMLAAHMAVTNIALLELVARTRDAIAGHPCQGDGIRRLDVLGSLTNRFMRTYTMQVEALARKRRKGGEQKRDGQACPRPLRRTGCRGRCEPWRHKRGGRKNGKQPYGSEPAAPAIPERPSMRSADQERQALPVPSDQEGALSPARRCTR